MAPSCLPLVAVLACLASTCTAAHAKWTVGSGALERGGDAAPSQNLTLAGAEATCAALAGCAGFTFEAATAAPSGVVQVFFKAQATSLNSDKAWWSYTKPVAGCPTVKVVWQPDWTLINQSSFPGNKGGLEDGVVVRRKVSRRRRRRCCRRRRRREPFPRPSRTARGSGTALPRTRLGRTLASACVRVRARSCVRVHACACVCMRVR